MTRFWHREHSSFGFSLIEVMAAIGIFSIITLGVTPLILTSVRGAGLNRSLTVGKNLVQQAMERARGLPYFESVKNQSPPQRRDVLDFYFPDRSTGFTSNRFTTMCTATASTPAASGALACPTENVDGTSRIPEGYTLTYEAEFVQPVLSTTPQTFSVAAPAATYNWNSVSNETPPSQLLRLAITASWDFGETRSFTLETIIGDKDLNPDRLRGTSTIDFVVAVSSSYIAPDGTLSNLLATAGSMNASIDLRSIADASTQAAPIVANLTREQTGTAQGALLATLTPVNVSLQAPPNQLPATAAGGGAGTMSHPDLGLAIVGHLQTEANTEAGSGVQVLDELPTAKTSTDMGGNISDQDQFWVTNQGPLGSLNPLLLDASRHMVGARRISPPTRKIKGSVNAFATAVSPVASRKVEGTATLQTGQIVILPTTFIPAVDAGVLVIRNFQADLTCRTNGSSGAGTTGSWSAELKYWQDTNINDIADGALATAATTSGWFEISGSVTATGADMLATLRSMIGNPVVYDAPEFEPDIHLFNDPGAGQTGYLQSWSSQRTMPRTMATIDSTVNLTNAISIQTALLDPANPASAMNINIGKASCEVVDNRG